MKRTHVDLVHEMARAKILVRGEMYITSSGMPTDRVYKPRSAAIDLMTIVPTGEADFHVHMEVAQRPMTYMIPPVEIPVLKVSSVAEGQRLVANFFNAHWCDSPELDLQEPDQVLIRANHDASDRMWLDNAMYPTAMSGHTFRLLQHLWDCVVRLAPLPDDEGDHVGYARHIFQVRLLGLLDDLQLRMFGRHQPVGVVR